MRAARPSRHCLPHAARLRARRDVSPVGALIGAGILCALMFVDRAWAASPVQSLRVEESAQLDVTVTVAAASAPTFQVFTLPGAPHSFVVELPGQSLDGIALDRSGPGVLLLDARVEAPAKGASGGQPRVVLAFADDVDYDATTAGGALVVKFAHTGDATALFAAAEKRRAAAEIARIAELEAKVRAEEAKAKAEAAEAARVAAIEQQKRDEIARKEAELAAKLAAEEERKAAIERKRVEEEAKKLAVLEAKKKADEEKKAAAEKKKQEAEAKKLALLEAKKKADEAKKAALEAKREQKRLEEQERRLAAMDAKRRADEEARIKAEDEAKRRAAEADAQKKAEEDKRLAALEAKKKAEDDKKAAAALEAQKKIDAELAAKRVEEEKKAAALEAQKKAAELAAQLRAEEERAARVAAEEKARQERLAAEQEAQRKLAAEEREREERVLEAKRKLDEEKRIAEERIAMARRAEAERAQQAEARRKAQQSYASISAVAESPRAPAPTARSDEPGFGGALASGKSVDLGARLRDGKNGGIAFGHSVDFAPAAHYARYVPPPDDDAFGGNAVTDEESDEDVIDEADGRSVLSQVTAQRTPSGARVGVRVDGGARYNVVRRGTELELTLFDTRAANLDVRRTLDARPLGTNVLRVLPSMEEDARYRVTLIVQLHHKAPAKIEQENGMLWLVVPD